MKNRLSTILLLLACGTMTLSIFSCSKSGTSNVKQFQGTYSGTYTPQTGTPTSDQVFITIDTITNKIYISDVASGTGPFTATVSGNNINIPSQTLTGNPETFSGSGTEDGTALGSSLSIVITGSYLSITSTGRFSGTKTSL